MEGTYIVHALEDTSDSIGDRTVICDFCKAKKYQRETASTCCSNGKVSLQSFPRPPKAFHKLWQENTAKGKVFRENARSLNNSLCLTSIQVKTRDFANSRFCPSIIFQGRATQRAGPLIAAEGDTPCFAQLLIHDPSLQSSIRFQNMTIPANMSSVQKKMIKEILEELQLELQKHNPFVQDFMQVIEIPPENLEHGKIVISAKNRPLGEHARRYNEQLNLKEVSILTNSEPHDLVLYQRGGPLQKISDLNPKGMPLHFIILFPYGTYGWIQS